MSITGFERMTDHLLRSVLFADILRKGEDKVQRRIIEAFKGELDFTQLDKLMISSAAWEHVTALDIVPQVVFAHPEILRANPTTSLYYRGMALLSQKRVGQAAASVTNWEDGSRKTPIRHDAAQKVACLYNAMISSIIEGSSDWTLDNGYRNVLATMGISLDGMYRNRIGQMAEDLVKNRIASWLKGKELLAPDCPEEGPYLLPDDTLMRYGSEPDIDFVRRNRLIATIEIKGGRDPAGALERLGAMTKSFAETPPGCVNFLIAGVITPEMQSRLNAMGNVKVYLLDEIAQDGKRWDDFMSEVFHYTIRVT